MKLLSACATIVTIAAVGLAGSQGKPKPMKLPPKTTMPIAQWQRIYDEGVKLFDAKDADGLFKMMTPDFTLSMNGKTLNAAQAKKSMKQWFAMMKDFHCSMKVTKVTGNPMTQVVTDSFNNWGMTMPDPKTHKSGKFVDKGSEVATWKNVKGKWMMQKLVTHDETMTIDGKPIKPGM